MQRSLVAALAVLATLAAGCGAAQRTRALADARWDLGLAARAAIEASGHHAVEEAVADARERLIGAVPGENSGGPSLLRDAFIDAVSTGDATSAARLRALWIPRSDDVKAAIAGVELAIANGDFDSARSQAWDAVERFDDARPSMMRLWYAAWAADPSFLSDVETIELDGPIDRVEHLGGGSTFTFRFIADGESVAAFKPWQSRRQSYYRGEIAAYRLCALIHCRFEVPRNREVRVDRDTFLALNGRDSRSSIARFDRFYDDLLWFEDEDGTQWLHGTAKDWVPEFRLFGIESHEVWRPLVEVDGALDEVDIPEVMARAFNTRRSSRLPDPGDLGDLDAESLGRQLSNLHVFDFLLNNWDRYSSRYWGVNCQWHRDHFVSIDNGASFPPVSSHGTVSSRPERYLHRIERFSRRTVDAVRWMEPTALYPILFPDTPHHDEKRDFEAFVTRRDLLLEYVDELIDEYGESAVLAFE